VSNPPLASHNTSFYQNTKIIKMVLVSNPPLASHDTLLKKIQNIKCFWCQPSHTGHMTLIFKNVERKLSKIKYFNQIFIKNYVSLISHL